MKTPTPEVKKSTKVSDSKLKLKPEYAGCLVASKVYSGTLGTASQEQLRSLVALNKKFSKYLEQ